MKKLLMIGDAGTRTGFARVLKSVADRLHASGEWEIVVRAVNWYEDHGVDYAYDVQPITYGDADPTGAATLPFHIDDIKPDAIWTVTDVWNAQRYAIEKPRDLPGVLYAPVDTPCMKWEWGLQLGAWSQVAAYTWFGAHELAAAAQDGIDVVIDNVRDRVPMDGKTRWISVPLEAERALELRLDRLARLQNLDGWHVLPHGWDRGLFGPRDKAACRKLFGIDEGAFVVGFVGTNQVRKRPDTAIRAFAKFARTHPDSLMVMHCFGGDLQGFDLAALARFYGVADKVMAVHWKWPELDDDALCSLYNSFDASLNTSSGEGFGLTSAETAACGVPQVVPEWAATREIWHEHALMVKVAGWQHMEKYLNTAHAVCSSDSAAEQLRRLADDEALRAEMSRRAVERVSQLPSWAEIGDGFAELLRRAVGEPEPAPTSLQDVLDLRREPVRSQVHPEYQALPEGAVEV